MRTLAIRPTDRAIYRDWVNNFLTVSRFAEYYALSETEASELIDRHRRYDSIISDMMQVARDVYGCELVNASPAVLNWVLRKFQHEPDASQALREYLTDNDLPAFAAIL